MRSSFTWVWSTALAAALSLATVGCGSKCGPTNCQGCCDSAGACVATAQDYCGLGGAECAVCTAGQQCFGGVCEALPTASASTTGSGTGSVGSTTGRHGQGSTTRITIASGSSGSTSGAQTSGTAGSSTTGSGSTSGTIADGGGTTGSCSFDAGPPVHCTMECSNGFHCDNGRCALNGGYGPVQVTLRWGSPEDLDLHVVEPGGCEVYYGNRTCVGSLDLDSNAGCAIDNVDTENVIYPPDGGPDGGISAPLGMYTVRVDLWSNCDMAPSIPYEVIVRNQGVVTNYCGDFNPAIADNGSMGAGTTVATFIVQ